MYITLRPNTGSVCGVTAFWDSDVQWTCSLAKVCGPGHETSKVRNLPGCFLRSCQYSTMFTDGRENEKPLNYLDSQSIVLWFCNRSHAFSKSKKQKKRDICFKGCNGVIKAAWWDWNGNTGICASVSQREGPLIAPRGSKRSSVVSLPEQSLCDMVWPPSPWD